jgi:hypothetical protein
MIHVYREQLGNIDTKKILDDTILKALENTADVVLHRMRERVGLLVAETGAGSKEGLIN